MEDGAKPHLLSSVVTLKYMVNSRLPLSIGGSSLKIGLINRGVCGASKKLFFSLENGNTKHFCIAWVNSK